MKSPKSVFWFLLLNVVVSATTTLTAIWLWEQYRQSAQPAEVTQNSSINKAEQTPVSYDLPPASQQVLKIENVFGVGDVQNEVILIRVSGTPTLWLENWVLTDETGNSFTFPALKVNDGGAINLYTRAGVNSAISLFWGLDKPVWQTGEVITITDYAGNVRVEYVIP